MKKRIILETNGRYEPQAFLVCDQGWNESAYAAGRDVFAWRQGVWIDCDLWAFDHVAIRAGAPAHINGDVIYGLRITAQSKGYEGPPTLPAIADWAGVNPEDYEIAKPLGRCRLIAAVMRSTRMQ